MINGQQLSPTRTWPTSIPLVRSTRPPGGAWSCRSNRHGSGRSRKALDTVGRAPKCCLVNFKLGISGSALTAATARCATLRVSRQPIVEHRSNLASFGRKPRSPSRDLEELGSVGEIEPKRDAIGCGSQHRALVIRPHQVTRSRVQRLPLPIFRTLRLRRPAIRSSLAISTSSPSAATMPVDVLLRADA